MGKGSVILGVLGASLGLGGCIVGLGWLQRDAILESMLEQNIAAVSGVEAQIKDVDSHMFKGEFTLEALTLSNPKEFNTPHLLKVNQLEVKLNPETLWQDTVEIESIAAEGVNIQVEQKLAKNNLAAIVEQLQKSSDGNRGDGGGGGSGQGKQVKIERLTIEGIEAQIKVSAIAGLGLTSTIEIEDIEVNDLNAYNAEGKLLEAISGAVTNAIVGELGKSTTPGSLISR